MKCLHRVYGIYSTLYTSLMNALVFHDHQTRMFWFPIYISHNKLQLLAQWGGGRRKRLLYSLTKFSLVLVPYIALYSSQSATTGNVTGHISVP